MLSQVPAEAVYSATYVENYLDCVENLPNDLQRLISRMRELDVNYLARVREAEAQSELWKTLGSENAARKGKTFFRMQQALSAAQELGDEKMSLLQTILEKIEMKTRLLDQDHKNLDFGKEESTGTDTKDISNSKTSGTSGGAPSAVNSTSGSERPVKRARRTRHDTYTEPTPTNDTSLNTSNNNSNTGSGSAHNNTTATSNNTNSTNTSSTNAISATATTAVATTNSNTTAGSQDSVNNTTGNTGNSAAATSGSLSTSNSNSGGGSGTTTSSSTQKKNSANSTTTGGATGKKKKRKSRNQQMAIAQAAAAAKEDTPPPRDEEPVIDPNEPTYCLCDQISFGEMIMCDNDLCPIEWFHFSCVSLATKPKGKWYCPKCRGDRPNVMKPKAQFLRELERFNKEKEEKT